MANLGRSLGSFLLIVGFLVLTALAAILYGGNTTQQEKMKQNIFWQGGRYLTDTLWAAAVGIGNAELKNSFNINQKIKEEVSQAELDRISFEEIGDNLAEDNASGSGFWSNLKARLAKKWSSNETGEGMSGEELPIKWQRTNEGAEIIFQSKSGQEHKLSLPFKFLSR